MSPQNRMTAAEICRNLCLREPARKLLTKEITPGAFIGELIEHQCFVDAIRFMAHALSVRDVVWWSTLCAWDAGGSSLPPVELDALRSAVRWVLDPSEENRKLAQAAANEAGIRTPAGCAAQAAAMAGSAADPNAPLQPRDALVAARAATAAVFFAASRRRQGKRSQKYADLLAVGWQISQTERHWRLVRN